MYDVVRHKTRKKARKGPLDSITLNSGNSNWPKLSIMAGKPFHFRQKPTHYSKPK